MSYRLCLSLTRLLILSYMRSRMFKSLLYFFHVIDFTCGPNRDKLGLSTPSPSQAQLLNGPNPIPAPSQPRAGSD